MRDFVPSPVRSPGEIPRTCEPLLGEYLRSVAAKPRTNTLLAQTFDPRMSFTIVGKEPTQIPTCEVLVSVQSQRLPQKENLVRLSDGESD